jgi:DNA-binding PadR family transcriptional regulator
MTRRGETLELAVLGLLHEHPLHGYELRKRLNVVLGWGRLLSYGSLYPALQRLLRAGLIREQRSAADPSAPGGRPPVAPSRRPRITYELTGQGRRHFATLMADAGPAAWEDDTFDVRFAFFGRIDREIRLRILEGRRARLEERLARLRQQLGQQPDQQPSRASVPDQSQQPSGGPRDGYTAELQRHGLELVEREVRWLTDLIAAERRAAPTD